MGGEAHFLLVHLQRSSLTQKWVLYLVSTKKTIRFVPKILTLAKFCDLGSNSKPIFSTYRQIFKKATVRILGKVVGNTVLIFGISILIKARRGGGHFASRHFPKAVVLASCKILGGPKAACYACSVFFSSSYWKLFDFKKFDWFLLTFL